MKPSLIHSYAFEQVTHQYSWGNWACSSRTLERTPPWPHQLLLLKHQQPHHQENLLHRRQIMEMRMLERVNGRIRLFLQVQNQVYSLWSFAQSVLVTKTGMFTSKDPSKESKHCCDRVDLTCICNVYFFGAVIVQCRIRYLERKRLFPCEIVFISRE